MKKKLLKISIIGKTNAGKSTLLNNLIGEIVSITNKKINTTEDLIIGVTNINNIQLIFYDTPGLHNLKNINKKNIKLKQNLWNGLNETDLIYDFFVSKFNKNFTYYQIIFNGTPNIFLKKMSDKDFTFDTQNKVWILQ